MALTFGDSGGGSSQGGYPKPSFRVAPTADRSGFNTRPSSGGGGWVSSLLEAARKVAEERRRREEEEERRRREEERRRQEAIEAMRRREEEERARIERIEREIAEREREQPRAEYGDTEIAALKEERNRARKRSIVEAEEQPQRDRADEDERHFKEELLRRRWRPDSTSPSAGAEVPPARVERRSPADDGLGWGTGVDSSEAQERRDREQLLAQKQELERRAADPLWKWATSPEGYDFLSAGGATKVDYAELARNPERYLAYNPNMREFGWGFQGELQGRVPDEVIERVARYAISEGNKVEFRPTGAVSVSPLDVIAEEVPYVGPVVAYGLGAIPGVGAALHGLGGTDDPSSPEFWADMIDAVSNQLLLSGPVNAAEGAVARRVGAGVGGKVASKAAGMAARGAVNAVEDTTVLAATSYLRGADPTSSEYWRALGTQAALSGAAGAVMPEVMPATGRVLRAVPPELKNAAAAYAAARALGADDDEAAAYAALAAGATSVSRRGLKESFRTGFGTTEWLSRLQRLPTSPEIRKLPDGPDVYYHGTAGEFTGRPRPGTFLTPNKADADKFALATSRLTGEQPQVLAFRVKPGAIMPSDIEGVAAARGAMRIVNPDLVEEVGRTAVRQQPAIGLGIEPVGRPPKGPDWFARQLRDARPEKVPTVEDVGVPAALVRASSPRDQVTEGALGTLSGRPAVDPKAADAVLNPKAKVFVLGGDEGTAPVHTDASARAHQVAAGVLKTMASLPDDELRKMAQDLYPDTPWMAIRNRDDVLHLLALRTIRDLGYDVLWDKRAADAAQEKVFVLNPDAIADTKMAGKVASELGEVTPSVKTKGVAAQVGGGVAPKSDVPGEPPPVAPRGPRPPQPPDGNLPGPQQGPGLPEGPDAEMAKLFPEFIDNANLQLSDHRFARAYDEFIRRVRGEPGVGNQDIRNLRAVLAETLRVPLQLLQVIDPASKYSRTVLRSVLAGANYINHHALMMAGYHREVLTTLEPLIGKPLARKLIQGSLEWTPAALGAAGMMAAGGPDEKEGRLAFAAGIFATGMAKYAGRRVPYRMPFEDVRYTRAKVDGKLPGAGVRVSLLPSYLRSGQGKLAHMVIYPEDFALTPQQRAALEGVQKILDREFQRMQAAQRYAGIEVTVDSLNQTNRLFQWFTRDSAEKVLGKEYFTIRTDLPDFMTPLPIERSRQLGDNIVQAIIQHPELRLDGDVVGLIMRDLDQKGRVIANAITVKSLTSGQEITDGFVVDTLKPLNEAYVQWERVANYAESSDAEIAMAQEHMAALRKAIAIEKQRLLSLGVDDTWQPMPGIEGYRFSPEVLESVKKLAVQERGEPMNVLDAVTSNVRSAMFTADFSAWTMNGYMLAARDPIGAIKVLPHTVAATLFGDAYTARWIQNNAELSKKWAARGLVNGRLVDEAVFGTAVGQAPLIAGIEERGYGGMLPIFRILMAEHMSRMEALASMATEGGRFRRILGRMGMNDLTRIIQFGAQYGPMAAGIGTAASTGEGVDPKDWEDWFAIALGAGGTAAMSAALTGVQRSALERMSPEQRAALEVRVAKDINRVSGIQNKPQMGISRQQAMLERNLMFRSPSLTRNAIILAKLALTSTGPEGAMARLYLLQLGLLTAGALYMGKYILTGERDSLDPTDPNSILYPETFGQLSLGAGGKITVVNPLLALGRAVLYRQYAEGESREGVKPPELRGAAEGLLRYVDARLPDVVGQAVRPFMRVAMEGVGTGEVDPARVGQAVSDTSFGALVGSVASGDVSTAAKAVGSMVVPVSIQETMAAGAIGPGDPNYNTRREQMLAPIASFLGLSYAPESLTEEMRRRTDEEIRKQFPKVSDRNKNGIVDRRDLNDEQRAQFDDSPAGKELMAFREYIRSVRPAEELSQVDRYFAAIDRETDLHVQRLKDLETAVASGTISKADYRQAYLAERSRFVEAKKSVERDFENQIVDRPVYDSKTGKVRTDMSVIEYIERDIMPEDRIVDEWFKLYDKAVGGNGKFDFDRLEELQEEFKRGLAPDELAYLERRLASFKDSGVRDSSGNVVALPALREYERVKEKAQPYWEIADREFEKLQQRDPFFRQFANYADYKRAVLAAAGGDPVLAKTIESGLQKRRRWLKRFAKDVERAQRTMRAMDVDLDIGLAQWYGRTPVNPLAYIAHQAGDTRFDALGRRFISGRRKVSARRQLQLAEQYGIAVPQFGEVFGYR